MIKLVKSKIIFNEKIDIDYNKFINIAYGIDNNFVRPLGVSMTSIVNNNPSSNIIFHIFTDYLDINSQSLLKIFAETTNSIVIIYLINTSIFNKLSYTKQFTKAMYNRFIMPKILNNNVKNFLYIDADTQCFNKLDTLFKINLNNNIVAVVNDLPYVKKQQIPALNLKNNNYFNSGFMYIDVKKWNIEKITEKAMDFSLNNSNKLKWQDQDVLNIVLDENCLYLEKKYNYLLNMKHKSAYMPNDVILVHYVGRYKPWTEWCLHPLKEKFLLVARSSLWKDIPLTKPITYKTMKMMGRSSILYGKYISGIYWYLKYAIYKIKSKL